MLQVPVLREQTDLVLKGLEKRNFKNAAQEIQAILDLDQKRRSLQTERDELLGRANALAKEIGGLMKSGQKEQAEQLKSETADLKQRTKSLDEEVQQLEHDLQQAIYKIPNIPHESVPAGKSAEDNEVVLEHGTIPALPENAQPHWDLIKQYDIIDFDLGVKTPAPFPGVQRPGCPSAARAHQLLLR